MPAYRHFAIALTNGPGSALWDGGVSIARVISKKYGPFFERQDFERKDDKDKVWLSKWEA